MAEKEYIERGALMEEVHRIGGHNLCGWETIGVKALVERQPAADVVEVVHGEDTGECRIFQCSICGYGVDDIFQADERNYPVGEFNFCPNCGAKMDGGKTK